MNLPDERLGEALSQLRPLAESTRAVSDCICCSLYQDLDDPASIWLKQEWASWESLQKNISSGAFRVVLATMELSASDPKLRFHMVQYLGGLEVVESARQDDRQNEVVHEWAKPVKFED